MTCRRSHRKCRAGIGILSHCLQPLLQSQRTNHLKQETRYYLKPAFIHSVKNHLWSTYSVPGPEKSIHILHLLLAFKESETLWGKPCNKVGTNTGGPRQDAKQSGSPTALNRRNGKSALPQRGPALPSCFPLPFRYSKVLLRLRKHCPLAWKAERLRGSGQQKRGARGPQTPRVKKGGQSEGPALVKFSASFPTSLGNAPETSQ